MIGQGLGIIRMNVSLTFIKATSSEKLFWLWALCVHAGSSLRRTVCRWSWQMTAAAFCFGSSGLGWCAPAQPMGARRGGEKRQIVLQCSAATSSSSRRVSRAVCRTSASFRLMDYTISLLVQNQLGVFPTHVCQSYSVELQVHPFSIPPLRVRVFLFRACFP